MTAIDRDQVLAALETLHDGEAKSGGDLMAAWRDGVWQAILEVRSLAALPAIPLDAELCKICADPVCDGKGQPKEPKHEPDPTLAAYHMLTRITLARMVRDANLEIDWLVAEIEKLKSGALPVLETPPPHKAANKSIASTPHCSASWRDDKGGWHFCDEPRGHTTHKCPICGTGAPVEPVPAPTSELRERIGRLWMEAGWAVTALESGQTPDDPLATARRYQGDMNALRMMIDNATFESAPVPAPRLEWVEVNPFHWQAVSQPYEIRSDGATGVGVVRKFNLWARDVERGGPSVFLFHDWMDTYQEAMAVAEKLNAAVLAPPSLSR